MLEQGADLVRPPLVEEQVPLAGAVPQALVNVTATPRQLAVPLGHEGRHDPEALPDLLGSGLEQDGPIRGLDRLGVKDGCLEHPGAGLRVQPLDGHAEGGHLVEQGVHIGLALRQPDQRVAEHAGRQRLRPEVVLGGQRLGRLAKVEELVLQRAESQEARLAQPSHHPLEQAARTDRERLFLLVPEVAQEERDISIPGNLAKGGKIDPGQRVRVAGVPPRVAGVVVTDVGRVPAEDHVAKAETALQRRQELVLVDVLSPQHTIDVGDGHLDLSGR